MRNKAIRHAKRIAHIRKKIYGTSERPRMVVSRSDRHIYAQLVDDDAGVSIAATSSLDPVFKDELKGKNKTQVANLVGKRMAEVAKEKGVVKIVFDRHGLLYHGRVKALAEGAREGGLEF
ncbi:MAG TPA: 50S ribosomal protein L18 [candidate division Zixibacteria bacterium]|nr:50S ribosomal protein L18 [candidate division Zixibacteria bacterium]